MDLVLSKVDLVVVVSGSEGEYLYANLDPSDGVYQGCEYQGKGGNQISGGTVFRETVPNQATEAYWGYFGRGGNHGVESFGNCGGCGGGGGWYGGAGSFRGHAGAGGGSGYIGNLYLENKHMVGYNVTTSNDTNTKTISVTNHSATPTADYAKEGNGYARITLISSN